VVQSHLNQYRIKSGVKFIVKIIADRSLFSFVLNRSVFDFNLIEELIIRKYRYIFTTLAVTASVVNIYMFVSIVSVKINHLMKNPSIGGMPPMLAYGIKIFVLFTIAYWIVIISVIFFIKKITEIITIQYAIVNNTNILIPMNPAKIIHLRLKTEDSLRISMIRFLLNA